MRTTRVALFAVALLMSLAIAAPALAQNPTDFEGTYVGAAGTSSGSSVGVTLWVKNLGGGWIDLTVSAGKVSGLPLPRQQVTWTGPDSFTISPVVKIPYVVDGSGKATFTKASNGWNVQGEGSGSVGFLGASGSASGSGKKVSDDFVEYQVVVSDRATTTTVVPEGATAEGVLASMSQKQPPVTDVEKAGAALADGVALLTGLLLCAWIGAPVSGAEFADMWLEELPK
jgi:hypothetical protein